MPGTDEQQEAYFAAYAVYKAVHDAHLNRMRVAVKGGPFDLEAAMAEAEQMGRLHADFMKKAEPFVHSSRR